MNINEMTVARLCDLIERRELSSLEITEAYLRRAVETESYGAYITLCERRARGKASLADNEYSEKGGEMSALKLVPYAVKDNIAVGGVKMTCASRMLENFVPRYTAAVVEKAGDVILGKTNMDEFAMGSSCESSYFGPAHNPHSFDCSPGGSSGGSAAAVGLNSAPWALGTDTGGSARQPASFCGTVAMKPTYGLVSRRGAAALASSLDAVCPITKNVYDNALVLEAIAGHDRGDMTSTKRESFAGEFTRGIERGVSGMRIGVPDSSEFAPFCSPDTLRCMRRAAETLEKLGAVLVPVEMSDPESVLGAYLVISQAECSSNMSRYDGLKYGLHADGADYREIMKNTREEGFGDEVKRRIIGGTYALSRRMGDGVYGEIKSIRAGICRFSDGMFLKCDAVLLPTSAGEAFRLGSHDADPTSLYWSDMFTVFANLASIPAISIPSGGNGVLPCGVELMGAKNSEALIYRAAYALEAELGEYVKAEVSANG